MGAWSVVPAARPQDKKQQRNMTETTLLLLVLLFLAGCFGVVYFYDRKLVKSIEEYEKRLEEKGIFKRHFTKRT